MNKLITPTLNPNFIVRETPEETILLSEKENIVIDEPIYRAIVQHIDGENTVEKILDQLDGQFNRTFLMYALLALQSKGCLLDKADLGGNPDDAYWLLQGVAPKKAYEILKQKQVSIKSFCTTNDESLKSALLHAGLSVSGSGVVDIIINDDYLDNRLSLYNQQAQVDQQPWLCIKPSGLEVWIGPFFISGKSACYECLKYYLSRNQRINTYINQSHTSVPSIAYNPHLNIAYNIAASLISRYLNNIDQDLPTNRIISINLLTLQISHHTFVKQPNCKACGNASKVPLQGSALQLQARNTTFKADGGYRNMMPEQTIQKYQHFISPITGIISNLTPMHNEPIWVYQAGLNHALSNSKPNTISKSLRSNCMGKGMSEAQAKASALCEGLERYSGEFQGNEELLYANFNDIADRAIHPNDCMLFSATQYHNRQQTQVSAIKFTQICEPFEKNAHINWTPVWSLTSKKFKYLPTQYLYYYYQNHYKEPFYCLPDSNGNAAGNCLEEAILQGCFELAERDAVAIWWYNRLKKPAVDLVTFNIPYFIQLQNFYRAQQRELWVLDISTDLGIPTFVALSKKINFSKPAIILGFGCHYDASLAISRALTEMNQMFAVVAKIENKAISQTDPVFSSWLARENTEDLAYLLPDAQLAPRVQQDYGLYETNDLLACINRFQSVIENLNMELLILNQTRSEVGLSVVKVLCPGLRHFWTRFAPGRLYDLPVKMGWLDKPVRENGLNPIPIFF